jgi:hypothetical protein
MPTRLRLVYGKLWAFNSRHNATEGLASVHLVTGVVSRDAHAIYIVFVRQEFLRLKKNDFYNINKHFLIHEVTTL